MTDNAPEMLDPEVHADKFDPSTGSDLVTFERYTAVCAERDAAEAEVARLRKYQARAKIAEAATFNALERLDASLFTNAEHQQAKDILRGALKPRQE